MKKQIITGIFVIACVALGATVWPRSAEVEDLSAESIKTAATAKIEARSKETPQILLSADSPAPKAEAVMDKVEPVEICEQESEELTKQEESEQKTA